MDAPELEIVNITSNIPRSTEGSRGRYDIGHLDFTLSDGRSIRDLEVIFCDTNCSRMPGVGIGYSDIELTPKMQGQLVKHVWSLLRPGHETGVS